MHLARRSLDDATEPPNDDDEDSAEQLRNEADENFIIGLLTANAVPTEMASTYAKVILESLDDARFRQEVRLSPPAFHDLASMLKSHEVFNSRSRNRQWSAQ
ncbi:hypothetical protein ACHHYP_02982 [Achlya hypogyna]|uniref:Uncharacterized protein n=1 Tax=Achlya hypogyna TaxID=1202772 RepID=A0A1V9Z522_ACHHY|nr:hypothetical protein ACHHYP_02982 [Achlya hypogyna]